jgi:hypothetical protein
MQSAKIWHYTTFPALMSIFQNGGLWLTRLANLRDPFEGLLMETGVLRALFNDSRGFVHCWTNAGGESEVFWLAYANPFGVAIQSTTRRLQLALSAAPDPRPEFAPIKYSDGKPSRYLDAWTVKRKWSQWEKEFRVYVPWHAGAPDDGLCVKADLKKLISAVWVSPYAPKWLDALVDREIQRHGLMLKTRRRPEPRVGPRPVTIKLDDFILNQCREEARAGGKALSDYIAGLLEDKFNPQ